jgi:hypothetical protein
MIDKDLRWQGEICSSSVDAREKLGTDVSLSNSIASSVWNRFN